MSPEVNTLAAAALFDRKEQLGTALSYCDFSRAKCRDFVGPLSSLLSSARSLAEGTVGIFV